MPEFFSCWPSDTMEDDEDFGEESSAEADSVTLGDSYFSKFTVLIEGRPAIDNVINDCYFSL